MFGFGLTDAIHKHGGTCQLKGPAGPGPFCWESLKYFTSTMPLLNQEYNGDSKIFRETS